MKIYTDGATFGKNGKLGTVEWVGLGVYIPELNVRHHKKVKGISNNEAEYKALIEALELCIQFKINNPTFYCDSEIIVNGANKPIEILDEKRMFDSGYIRMYRFRQIVHDLKSQLESAEFNWMPREENVIADELSKKALI